MSISDAHRRRRRGAQGLGGGFSIQTPGFVPTQPGDPEFSYTSTPDSQAQFPAAAAEQRLFENSRRAQNILQNAVAHGIDVNAPEYAPVREAAERGLITQDVPLGLRLIGWLDGPRQMVNLAMQDMFGGAAEEGKRNPHVGDYINALLGGIEQQELFEYQTGLDPVSGSETLGLMGWEEEDDTLGRFSRGVADFGLQILTDPLTYVTFGLSGLGKKVARSAVEKFSRSAIPSVLEGVAAGSVDHLPSYLRKLGNSLPDLRAGLVDKFRNLTPEMQRSLRDYMKKNYNVEVGSLDELLGVASQHLDELALRNQIGEDILAPALRRDFAAIPEAAKELLPAFLRGGVRISFPLGGTWGLTHGITVPGTEGLGRKLVGQPFRDLAARLKQNSVTAKGFEWLGSISDSMDVDRRLLKSLGAGRIEGWQYHIAMNAIDMMRNSSLKEMHISQINAAASDLFDAAEKLGFTDQQALLVDVLNRVENVRGLTEVETAFLGLHETVSRAAAKPLEEQLEAFAGLLSDTMRTYYDNLRAVLPKDVLGDIENYIPHVVDKQSSPVLNQLADLGAVMSRDEIMRLQREGSVGGVVLAQLVNAVGRGGRIEAQVGKTRHFSSREVGRTTAVEGVFSLTDEGGVMIPKMTLARAVDEAGFLVEDAVKPKFLSVSELNRELEGAIRQLAQEGKITLPRNWNGKIFDENPLTIISSYIHNLDETARWWQAVDSLKAAGLAFEHHTALDVGETVQSMLSVAAKNAVRVTEEIYPPLLWGGKDDLNRGFNDVLAALESLRASGDELDFGFVQGMVRSLERQTGPHPLLEKSLAAAKAQDFDKAYASFREFMEHTLRRPAAQADMLYRSSWEAKMSPEEIISRGGAIHFGSQQAALDRSNTLVNDDIFFQQTTATKSGVMRSARIRPKKPYGSISQPRKDTEQYKYVLDEGVGAGDAVMPEIRQYYDELREQGYDAVIYSNTVEGATVGGAQPSVSIAVLDPKIIEWADEFPLGTVPGGRGKVSRVKVAKREVGRRIAGSPEDYASRFNVPKHVVHEIVDAGMDVDVAGNKQLYDSAMGLSVEQFLSMRAKPTKALVAPLKKIRELIENSSPERRAIVPDMAEPNTTLMRNLPDGNNVVIRYDDRGKLSVLAHYTVTDGGRLASVSWGAAARGSRLLDEEVAVLDAIINKELGAKYTAQTVNDILSNTELTDSAGRALHSLLQRKFAGLSDDTLHYITNGEPAEMTRFRYLFNVLQDMYNDVVTGYGQVMLAGTNAKLPNSQLRLLADEELENVLDNAYELAKALDVPQFKKIFHSGPGGTRKYTGISDYDSFVNPNIFALGGPALGNLQVQSDIAVWLRQAVRNATTIYTPEGIAALKLQSNTVLRWWKGMATIARPAFHIRNFLGGMYNNQIVGVRMRDYAWVRDSAIKIKNFMREGKGDWYDAIDNVISSAADREVWKAALDQGILTSGFITSEFRNLSAAEKKARLSWLKAWDAENFVLTRLGGLAMESIEDFMRMATFKAWYRVGDEASALVARDMVYAVHFNYKELTPLETSIKSLVPFFVWTRRNLPLQLGVMLENPRIVQRYRAMMQSMDSAFDEEPGEGLPQGENFSAFAAGTRVYVNANTPFWARMMIDPDVPINDIAELQGLSPPNLVEFVNNLLGPHVSALVDMNREREFGDVNAPAPMNLVLKSLAAVGFFDNTQSGDVRVPYWLRTLAETAIPFTKDIIEPVLGGPTDPARQQRQGISQDDSGLESALKSLAATLGRGAGVKFTTPSDVRGPAFETQEKLDELIGRLRFQGAFPPAGQ